MTRILPVTNAAGALLAWLLVLVLVGCAGDRPTLLRGAVMGTTWSVQIVGPRQDDLAEAIQRRLDAINGLMTTYSEGSELSRFNRTPATDWVSVAPELARVVTEALRIATLSDGALDVTAGPLVELWGFGVSDSGAALPTESAVMAARQRVGFQDLAVRAAPAAVRKSRADMTLDLSAIAKGYAVDEVAALLDSRGLTNYLVEIGGELKGRGRNARGEVWTIAVEEPTPGDRRVQRAFALRDLAVATSGDYRNFYVRDGRRYSHTIDPRSGYPVAHRLASVTVLDASAMSADGYATALLVLGEEAGFQWALAHDLAALFLIRDGDGFSERQTPRFVALTTASG